MVVVVVVVVFVVVGGGGIGEHHRSSIQYDMRVRNALMCLLYARSPFINQSPQLVGGA